MILTLCLSLDVLFFIAWLRVLVENVLFIIIIISFLLFTVSANLNNIISYDHHSIWLNVREYQRSNQNGQSRETGNKTKTNKAKTQHNLCWTPLSATKHKKRNKDMIQSGQLSGFSFMTACTVLSRHHR